MGVRFSYKVNHTDSKEHTMSLMFILGAIVAYYLGLGLPKQEKAPKQRSNAWRGTL